MKDNLVNFYEERYSTDQYIKMLEVVPYKKYPTNRNETCVKYFIDHFQNEGIVLELGAGNGTIANSILKQNKKISKYYITDLSKNRLSNIKDNIEDDRVYTKQIDVENFNFEEIEKVDAIIMVALIEHLIDPLGTMKKIREVLKPNGFVYIDTPNIADYGARFKLARGIFPSTSSKNEGLLTYDNQPVSLHDEGHLHYFTYSALSNMLINYCGFDDITKHYQMVGKRFLGKMIHHQLAKMWPEMFSTLILIARKH